MQSFALPQLCDNSGCLKSRAPEASYCVDHLPVVERLARGIVDAGYDPGIHFVSKRLHNIRQKVYVICDGTYVKFGVSKAPRKRMSDLQVSNPYTLSLLGHVPGDGQLESFIHVYCSDEHVRGEWFRREGKAKEIEAIIVARQPLELYRLVGYTPLVGRRKN